MRLVDAHNVDLNEFGFKLLRFRCEPLPGRRGATAELSRLVYIAASWTRTPRELDTMSDEVRRRRGVIGRELFLPWLKLVLQENPDALHLGLAPEPPIVIGRFARDPTTLLSAHMTRDHARHLAMLNTIQLLVGFKLFYDVIGHVLAFWLDHLAVVPLEDELEADAAVRRAAAVGTVRSRPGSVSPRSAMNTHRDAGFTPVMSPAATPRTMERGDEPPAVSIALPKAQLGSAIEVDALAKRLEREVTVVLPSPPEDEQVVDILTVMFRRVPRLEELLLTLYSNPKAAPATDIEGSSVRKGISESDALLFSQRRMLRWLSLVVAANHTVSLKLIQDCLVMPAPMSHRNVVRALPFPVLRVFCY